MVLEETIYYSIRPLDQMKSKKNSGLLTTAVSGPTAAVMCLISGEDRGGSISLSLSLSKKEKSEGTPNDPRPTGTYETLTPNGHSLHTCGLCGERREQ